MISIKTMRMKKLARLLSLLTLLLSVGGVFAHHGNSAYDETVRVPIKGTVTEFIWTNPHSQIYVDVKDSSGKVVNWGVETNSPGLLTGLDGLAVRSRLKGLGATSFFVPPRMANPSRDRETPAPKSFSPMAANWTSWIRR